MVISSLYFIIYNLNNSILVANFYSTLNFHALGEQNEFKY